MKLTKGKISKLYTKINQSAKKRKNNKRKPNKSKTFRKKRKMNLANRSFKKGQFRKYRGGDPSSSSADPSSSSPDLSSSGQAEGVSSENINTSTVDDVSQQQDPNLSNAVQAEGSSENIVPVAADDVSQQEQDVVASSTSDASSSTSSSIVIVDPTTNNKGEVILTNEANEALEAPVASSSQPENITSSQSGDDISSSQPENITSSQSGDDVSSQILGSSETTSNPINQSNLNPNVSSETSSQPSGKTEVSIAAVSIAAVNALKDIALSGVTSGNNDGIQNGEYAVGMQAGEAASMGGGKNKTKKFKLTKKGKTRNKRE